MSNIFKAIEEKHDGRNRVVFVCEDPQGYYVFKPATGFKTKHWPKSTTKALRECFARQVSCGHQHSFYNPGEAPAADENYSLKKPKVVRVPKVPAIPPVPPVAPVKEEENA